MLKSKGLFGYHTELESEIFAFQAAEYPDRRAEEIPAHWRWLFVASATRLGVDPFVWVYRREGAVVAHQGAIAVRAKIGDVEVTTGWFVETMAGQAIRGTAIGPMVVKKALEDLPFNLSLGQTEQMRKLQYALGWERVCGLPRYLFVSGYRMDLASKLPPGFAGLAAIGLGMIGKLRLALRRLGRRTHFSVSGVDRFSSRHDELWSRMSRTCACAVVRDASYLNWKYRDRPSAEKFSCIEVRDDANVVGIAVLLLSEPNDVYRYRRGFIVDLVVPLDRPDAMERLFLESIRILADKGAQTVSCYVSSAPVERVLKACGFGARSHRHEFLVATQGTAVDTTKALDGANWFLTLGDSDADAYPD